MPTPPDFKIQNHELKTQHERNEWFKATAADLRTHGATWFRFTVDNEANPTKCLVEGWKVAPDEAPRDPDWDLP